MSNAAVFLDRDGVLNAAAVHDGRPFPPSSIDELVMLPGVLLACHLLRQSGLRLLVNVTQKWPARPAARRHFATGSMQGPKRFSIPSAKAAPPRSLSV